MSSKYRVMQEVYVNRYGVKEPGKFYIQYLWFKIFGLSIWRSIKHVVYGGWGDSYNEVTKFETAKEARDHIKDLCSRVHNGKWTKKIVSTHYCNGISIEHINE